MKTANKTATTVLHLGLVALVCLFFTDTRAHADYIYASLVGDPGTIMRFDSRNGNGSVFASGLNMPRGLACDSSGNLYVRNEWDNTLVKFGPSGNRRGSITVASSSDWSLASDRSGNLYVPIGGTIWKYNSSLGNGSLFANFGTAWLACDRSGTLYASSGNTIEKFDSLGNHSTFATLSYGTGAGCFDFDGGGNLDVWALDSITRTRYVIEKFDPSGHEFQHFYMDLNTPRGLVCDGNGNVYVADHLADKIEEYDSLGNASVFASGLGSVWGLAEVPEPGALALVLLGASTLLGSRCLRRRSS